MLVVQREGKPTRYVSNAALLAAVTGLVIVLTGAFVAGWVVYDWI